LLMAIDVGNTNVVIGLFQGEELQHQWRLSTDRSRTADDYAVLIKGLMDMVGMSMEEVDGAVLASVVPPLVGTFRELCSGYLKVKPLIIGPNIKTGVRVLYDNPREVGADRIVNAAAAHREYGGPVIVVDFGTATTFDVISRQGEYLGGAIAPGIGISTEALFHRAAKLPKIELREPPSVIGKNTIHSMQSGIVFGFAGQVDALNRRIAEELGEEPMVVATGGLAELVAGVSETIQAVDPLLTIKGLRIIYELNT